MQMDQVPAPCVPYAPPSELRGPELTAVTQTHTQVDRVGTDLLPKHVGRKKAPHQVPGASDTSSTEPGYDCGRGSRTVECTLTKLTPGSTFKLYVDVEAEMASIRLENVAVVNPENLSATAVVNVQ
jgi:hypothetical protein